MTPFTDDVAARLRAANPSPRYGAVVVDIADRDAALEEIARLRSKLQRVSDFIAFQANSEGGLRAEIEAALRSPPPPSGVVAETAVKARWIQRDDGYDGCPKCDAAFWRFNTGLGREIVAAQRAAHERACWPQPEPRR